MLLQPLAHFRVVLDSLDLRLHDGKGLVFHGMSVPETGDEDVLRMCHCWYVPKTLATESYPLENVNGPGGISRFTYVKLARMRYPSDPSHQRSIGSGLASGGVEASKKRRSVEKVRRKRGIDQIYRGEIGSEG